MADATSTMGEKRGRNKRVLTHVFGNGKGKGGEGVTAWCGSRFVVDLGKSTNTKLLFATRSEPKALGGGNIMPGEEKRERLVIKGQGGVRAW